MGPFRGGTGDTYPVEPPGTLGRPIVWSLMSDRMDLLPGVAVMCMKFACESLACTAGTAVNGRAATPVPSWGSSAYHGQPNTDSSTVSLVKRSLW